MVTRVVRERLEWLRRAGRRCKLIYTIVNFQNPAGPDLSLRRRTELVRLAEEYDTLILEDDAYGELRVEGEPKPPVYALDRGGRVVPARTLSENLRARGPLRRVSASPSATSHRRSATRAPGSSRARSSTRGGNARSEPPPTAGEAGADSRYRVTMIVAADSSLITLSRFSGANAWVFAT